MSYMFFCFAWTVLQSPKFSCVLVFSLAVFLHASLCSVETGSVATASPSSEGLSQDVALMHIYLLGEAEALMLA